MTSLHVAGDWVTSSILELCWSKIPERRGAQRCFISSDAVDGALEKMGGEMDFANRVLFGAKIYNREEEV